MHEVRQVLQGVGKAEDGSAVKLFVGSSTRDREHVLKDCGLHGEEPVYLKRSVAGLLNMFFFPLPPLLCGRYSVHEVHNSTCGCFVQNPDQAGLSASANGQYHNKSEDLRVV